LLIQVIRQVLAGQRQPTGRGWVEGLRDPHIAAALAAIHGEPEQPWSLDSLAIRAGLCRSLFAARFAERVGSTPMSYLARVRAQLPPPPPRRGGPAPSQDLSPPRSAQGAL